MGFGTGEKDSQIPFLKGSAGESLNMDNVGTLFLCSCCGAKFPSALLLSQHCVTHHKIFELSPFLSVQGLAAANQGLVSNQALPNPNDLIDQQPIAKSRKHSSHDITLTQLKTVTLPSQAHTMPSLHPQQQHGVTKHDRRDKTPVSSLNSALQFGSGYFIMSGSAQSDIINATQASDERDTQGKTQYAFVVNPSHRSVLDSETNSRNNSDSDGLQRMQTTNQSESNLQSLDVPSNPDDRARSMETRLDGMYTVPNRFSVIQSNHCVLSGKQDNINQGSSQIQKQTSQSMTTTKLASTMLTSIKDNALLTRTNPAEGSLKQPVSSPPVLPSNQQEKALSTSTPAFPMGFLASMGVPQGSPIIKLTKPSRGSGPRPFSCPICEKTFTLKCNLQQHEVYAHTDDRPYACSQCEKTFKLKGHLKEHEQNAHSENRPFKCSLCDKTFKQKSHLTGHMSIHDGSKPHRCETCGLVFRQKQHLKRHALTHTGKRLFSCPQCPSSFNISSDLKRHTRIHTGERPFICSHCGKGFARKQAVKIHEKIHFRPFTCQRCKKSFRDLQALTGHEKEHVKSLSHDCRECGQSFSLFIQLKGHMKLHSKKTSTGKKTKRKDGKKIPVQPCPRVTRQKTASEAMSSHRKTKQTLRPASRVQPSNKTLHLTEDDNEEEKLSCSVCERTFLKKCYLVRHELKCHGIQHIPYRCEKCGEIFTGRTALVTHTKEHKHQETFSCNHCKDSFKCESFLHRHLISSHNFKPFSCNVCSKTFVQKTSHEAHIRTCTKEDTVHCELCEDVFKQESSLLRHKVKVHGLQPYTCSVCNRGFSEKGTLQRHMVTHSNNRLHRCQYCSKTFKEKRQVDQHEKTHRGERPFQCFQCGLSFHRKAYLERHEAIHTGEKRYRCPHCPTAFFMGHDLKRHLRIHTGEKPYVCKICKKAFRRKAAVAYHEKQVHMRKFQCSYCSRKFFTKAELDAHRVMHLGVAQQTSRGISGPSQVTGGSAEHSSRTPSGDNSKAPNESPQPAPADTSTIRDHMINAQTLSIQKGSVSDDLQTPALPSSKSSKSHLDASTGHTTQSNAASVTFYLCNSCGSLFPSAAMLARHTQQLHNPSLTINNPTPMTKSAKRQRTKRESRRKTKKNEDTAKAIDGTVKMRMCTKCGEEYMGDWRVHECVDHSVDPGSPGPEIVEDPGPDYMDSQYPVWTDRQSKEKDGSLFYCGHCDKGFKKISSRNVHQRIHTGDKPFVCKTCHKAFSVKSNLKQHEIAKHTNERPYACSECDAKFKQRSHLKSHEEIHAGVKNYKCTVCNQTFRQPSHLQRHKLVHDGIKQYKCEQCPSAFNVESDLERHSMIHSGMKPFPCDQCEKRFRRKFQLKVHRQTHTGELPLQCPHCRKAFMDKRCFESHVSAHEGKALHQCASCKKSFSTEYVLKTHSCGKTTARSFKCGQCSKSFKHKVSFDNHRCSGGTEKKGQTPLSLNLER